jgi:hypothetical protein
MQKLQVSHNRIMSTNPGRAHIRFSFITSVLPVAFGTMCGGTEHLAVLALTASAAYRGAARAGAHSARSLCDSSPVPKTLDVPGAEVV